jgi:hypothetical protein
METKIILDGVELPVTSLDWLMRQDLNYLHHHIANGYIYAQTKEGGGAGLAPNAEIKSIYVLLYVLNELRSHQPQWLALVNQHR